MTPDKLYNTSYAEINLWYCLILLTDFMTKFVPTWNFVFEIETKSSENDGKMYNFL